MVNNPFSSWRKALSPQKALELANIHLENARKTKDIDLELALELCGDAATALSRMKRTAKNTLLTSSQSVDKALRDGIATAYFGIGELAALLGCRNRAQISYKKAEKWGHLHANPTKGADTAVSSPPNSTGRDVARVPKHIFPEGVRQTAVKCGLPEADGRLSDTRQLAYCLRLLQVAPSLEEVLEPAASDWVKTTENNEEEKERLKRLANDLIRAFTGDDFKDAKAVAEVVRLAPILEKDDFQHLLTLFANGIDQSSLLDVNSVEGLAQLMQSASPGYLDADDLVSILRILNRRLQETHMQSPQKIYQLTLATSHVLDAMADSRVEGLSREQLHEPLSAYLDGLKGSADPYLVYQAAYAFQALQYVPDDETPWQATLRRTRVVVKGASELVSAVKGLDLEGFINGLDHIQGGFQQVYQVAKIGYEGVSSLVESGLGFLDSLKEGLSFNQKRAWYQALRGTDALLQQGRLAEFRTLVCEAPCRRDIAFEWGLCQRLGELAGSPLWNSTARQSAVDFLGEMYKNDLDWGQQAKVKQWILTILVQLSESPDSFIKTNAHTLLQELRQDGGAEKQALYQACRKDPPSAYQLKVCSLPPASPSLLDRVQSIPDIEYDLRRLSRRRLRERDDAVYIPPLAKANLQAPDDMLFDLTKNVEGFLSSEHYKVLLLLGDSGSGKSIFSQALERDLWRRYNKKEGRNRIPLHINLPAIDKPERDLIAKHLRRNDFTEPQIREMKDHREFILICDGYDESQQIQNLYTSNQLNQAGHWRAQMVISCRSDYLPNDYKDRFQPEYDSHSDPSNILQEAVLAPFSAAQIKDYIKAYVLTTRPLWRTKDYLDAVDRIPNLRDLVKNPFLLMLALEVLPRVVDARQKEDLSGTRITRVALYDQFVEQWLERGKRRVGGKNLSPQARAAFDNVADEGFTQNGMAFLKKLAGAIYKEQAGHSVVEYSRFRDERTWKAEFFRREDEMQLLREACPLARSGNQYRFIHRSLLEYGFARAVFEPQESKRSLGPTVDPEEKKNVLRQTRAPHRRISISSVFSFEDPAAQEEEFIDVQQPLDDHPLTWRNLANEPSILQFLAERVQQEPLFERQLQAMVERSKVDKEARKAAANAITILVRAGIRFNEVDLRGVQIPGADLSGGQFDSALLQGADLRTVNFRNVWLRQANLSNARMTGAHFGEWPYLMENEGVTSCAYSPDGNTCAVALRDGTISVYDSLTWKKNHTLSGHSSGITRVAFSPSGKQIASSSYDKTVRLWDAQTGALRSILSGHDRPIMTLHYSPNGQQLASGSVDKTVRLWDAQTGALSSVLIGHAGEVTSVAFSNSGEQIASASADKTLRLWDVLTGAPGPILRGHTDPVLKVVYSPKGHQLASCSTDKMVRLWDGETGAPGPILRGHVGMVWGVVYSPSGKQIASCSLDMTVRLWDTQTGASNSILRGHSGGVTTLLYSPSGQQLASGGADKTVRLWDTQTGTLSSVLNGHTSDVKAIAYSPSGRQLASGGYDKTLRLWDIASDPSSPVLGGHTDSVRNVVFSHSGEQLASCSIDKTVRLWDVRTGTPGPILRGHTGQVTSVAYSPNDLQIASGSIDKTARLWDSKTGAPGLILEGQTSGITSMVFSPSGQQIASGSADKTVHLWDAQTGAPGPILSGHKIGITSVVYSPSSQQIAVVSGDYKIWLWDTQTGALGPVLSGHDLWICSAVFSPSGKQIASGSGDKTVRLWDAQTGVSGPILRGHTGAVGSVIYSPNGQQLASCSIDKTVMLWDAETGAPGLVLSGHTGEITSVAYSPTCQHIISGSDDMTVRLWDVNSGQCLAVVEGFHGHITSIAWDPTLDSPYFATGCADSSVRMWQVVEEKDQYRVRLHWTSTPDRIAVSNASVQSVQGLNKIQVRLLEQRGAVGDPIPPPSFRQVSKKLITMASVVSKARKPSIHTVLHTIATANSLGTKSVEPVALANVSLSE